MLSVTKSDSVKDMLAHCVGSSRLRNLATAFVGVSLLAGCIERDPNQIAAEEFRTNFSAYAGQTVAFDAYYTKEKIGTKEAPVEPSIVYRYDFFSDAERSLKVASFTSTQSTVRDKVTVTIPIATNRLKNVTIEWDKLTFSGVDDVTKPANPNTVDRQIEKLKEKDSAPLLEKGGSIR